MIHHGVMLEQILASIGFAVPLHFPDVPDIPSLTKISTSLASNETHPPTYDHLYSPLLVQKESNNKNITYKKNPMTLIKKVINAVY